MVIHTIHYISIDDRLIYERETGVDSAVRNTVYPTRGQIIESNRTILEEFKEDLVQFEDQDDLMLEFEFLRVGFSFADLTDDQICKLMTEHPKLIEVSPTRAKCTDLWLKMLTKYGV